MTRGNGVVDKLGQLNLEQICRNFVDVNLFSCRTRAHKNFCQITKLKDVKTSPKPDPVKRSPTNTWSVFL